MLTGCDETNEDERIELAVTGVRMVTTVERERITYAVELGIPPGEGAEYDQTEVWRFEVELGRDKASRAGGPRCRDAAREQERVAHEYARAARNREENDAAEERCAETGDDE